MDGGRGWLLQAEHALLWGTPPSIEVWAARPAPAPSWHSKLRMAKRACSLEHELLGAQGIHQARHHVGPPAVHVLGDACRPGIRSWSG